MFYKNDSLLHLHNLLLLGILRGAKVVNCQASLQNKKKKVTTNIDSYMYIQVGLTFFSLSIKSKVSYLR